MELIPGPFDFRFPGCVAISLKYDRQVFRPENYERYGLKVPEELTRASVLRKNEFLAGRLCAFQALKVLDHPVSILPRGPQGGPVWPSGIVGSITHNNFFAAAMVAKENRYSGIGIDCEPMVNESTYAIIKETVLVDSELEYLQASSVSEALFAVLVFSAKESVFKAHSSLLPSFINPQDITISGLDFAKMEFRYTLKVELHTQRIDSSGTGFFSLRGGLMHTLVLKPKSSLFTKPI